jgi:hypothetical protein
LNHNSSLSRAQFSREAAASPTLAPRTVERAEYRLNLARKKMAQFKNNEMDVRDPSHRRGLRWLDDEVSKAETELAWARRKLENGYRVVHA